MKRYNPPSTSQQARCFGCQRHIQKCEEEMNQKHLVAIGSEIMKSQKDEHIAMLERQVAGLKMQLALKEEPVLVTPSSDEELARKVEVLTEMNKRLVEQLDTASREFDPIKLFSWREVIDANWQVTFERLRRMAINHCDSLEVQNAELKEQNAEMKEMLEVIDGNPLLKTTVEAVKKMEDETRTELEKKHRAGQHIALEDFQRIGEHTEQLIKKFDEAMKKQLEEKAASEKQ